MPLAAIARATASKHLHRANRDALHVGATGKDQSRIEFSGRTAQAADHTDLPPTRMAPNERASVAAPPTSTAWSTPRPPVNPSAAFSRALPEAAHDPLAESQSSGSTCTSLWSWLLPTQNVTGVVELSTNTVRMFVSDGMRYCTPEPVFGSSRTTRSVCMVEAHSSPFLSKLARYGNV